MPESAVRKSVSAQQRERHEGREHVRRDGVPEGARERVAVAVGAGLRDAPAAGSEHDVPGDEAPHRREHEPTVPAVMTRRDAALDTRGAGGREECIEHGAGVVGVGELTRSSRFKTTPSSRKNATVSGTSKRRSTLWMALGDEPANACSSTVSCVTLQRPPPAIRILAPSFFAPSKAMTRAPDCAAHIAAMSPAAPAPMTTTCFTRTYARGPSALMM